MQTPTNKYNEIVEQCKQAAEQIRQALTVIVLSGDIIRTRETLSPEGKECLQAITSQAWRINKELKKGERTMNKNKARSKIQDRGVFYFNKICQVCKKLVWGKSKESHRKAKKDCRLKMRKHHQEEGKKEKRG